MNLFCSLRAHQYSSDQIKILKGHSAQTTARVVSDKGFRGSKNKKNVPK